MTHMKKIFLWVFFICGILILSRSNGWKGGGVMDKYGITKAEVSAS